jgi:predicted phage baseplate assembly protein
MQTETCECNALDAPPMIPQGLRSLPRQRENFASIRQSLIDLVASQEALTEWRARDRGDLGVMLLELWAYVLDIVSFYDARTADESYLRTAKLRESARRLCQLTGYSPRPASAATVWLAALAEGKQPLELESGAPFRSDAFAGKEPQVFESSSRTLIDPKRNLFKIAGVRRLVWPSASRSDRRILLEPSGVGLVRGHVGILEWSAAIYGNSQLDSPSVESLEQGIPTTFADLDQRIDLAKMAEVVHRGKGFSQLHARRVFSATVSELKSTVEVDGALYTEALFRQVPELPVGLLLDRVRAWSMSLTASVSGFPRVTYRKTTTTGEIPQTVLVPVIEDPNVAEPDVDEESDGYRLVSGPKSTYINLDAIYSTIKSGDLVAVERRGVVLAVQVVETQVIQLWSNRTAVPVTQLRLAPPLPEEWTRENTQHGLSVHYNKVPAGTLTRVTDLDVLETDLKTTDAKGSIQSAGIELIGPVEPWSSRAPYKGTFLLRDANQRGVRVAGSIAMDGRGVARFRLDANAKIEGSLRAPIEVYGNVVAATRGESVVGEVLGSGDSAQAFQSFRLAKRPLTYVSDAQAQDGLRSTLELWVDGVRWREVRSFYGRGPNDHVYVLLQDHESNTIVRFGDGQNGARPATGSGNIRVNYRFGAGAATPPPGGIRQLGRSIDGVRRVVQPSAADGGSDAEAAGEIRRNAPLSALLLDRAVSELDFLAAMLREPGVVNAAVRWSWAKAAQRPLLLVTYIAADPKSPETEMNARLLASLRSIADAHVPMQVARARRVSESIHLEISVDDDRIPSEVGQAVSARLLDPLDGLLAPRNVPIGGAIPNSRIFHEAFAVMGVRDVSRLVVPSNGGLMPTIIPPPKPGTYREYTLTVATKRSGIERGGVSYPESLALTVAALRAQEGGL